MEWTQKCPECGAIWQGGKTCQDDFYQMLYWENESPALGEVHHLTVLCYHLQHPSLYSPEGLEQAKNLLAEFVEGGQSPGVVRQLNRGRVDSGRRKWRIKGAPASHGAYDKPVQWKMTAREVVEGGPDHYCESVRKWARLTLDILKLSGI